MFSGRALEAVTESRNWCTAALVRQEFQPTAFGRVANPQLKMMRARPPPSLRSRLPLTGGRFRLQRDTFIPPLPEGESRRRRQGVAHTPSRIGVGQHPFARVYIL